MIPWTRIAVREAGAPTLCFSTTNNNLIKKNKTTFLLTNGVHSIIIHNIIITVIILRKLKRRLCNSEDAERRIKPWKCTAPFPAVGPPTLRQWNSAMDACARARPTRLTTCFELFQEGIDVHHFQPNEYSFGAIMSACSRARRADRAIQVLQDMKVCLRYTMYTCYSM